jgi:hypothetical protein
VFIDNGVVRPGAEAVLKLLPHFRLGVYSCFPASWMEAALAKVNAGIQQAASGACGMHRWRRSPEHSVKQTWTAAAPVY